MFYLGLARIILILSAAVLFYIFSHKFFPFSLKGKKSLNIGISLVLLNLLTGALFHSNFLPSDLDEKYLKVVGFLTGYIGQTLGIILLLYGVYQLIKSLRPYLIVQYPKMVEKAVVGMYIIENGRFQFVNSSFIKIFGYDRQELIGAPVEKLVAPDQNSFVREKLDRILEDNHPANEFQFQGLTKSGERIQLVTYVNKTFHNDSPIIHGSIIDVTEQHKMAQQLRESEERYRKLIDVAPDAIAVHSDGIIKLINKACLQLIGAKSEDEVLGQSVLKFLHPDFHEIALKRIKESLATSSEIPVMEEKLLRLDGTVLDVEINGIPLTYQEKPAIISIVRDITRRKIAENALKASEEKFRTLFEESLDTIFITSPEGKILDINAEGVKLFGYDSKEELLKADISRDLYVNPEDRQKISAILEKEGKIKDYELMLHRKDGKKIIVLESATVVRDNLGKIVAYRGILRDVTEKKQLEQQFFQAQKMESIGTLAGGIAHDFNNILGGILGYASFMKMKMKEDDPNYKFLDIIEKGAERAAELTSKLLAFARGGKYNIKPLNLNRIVTETIAIIERTFEKSIEIVVNLHPELPTIEGDSTQVQQILMNLSVNSRDAMPDGGKLFISTNVAKIKEDKINQHFAIKSGEYVCLTLQDTGTGMQQAVLSKIFDPFFTTKPKGKGSGLGLAMVYGVVKSHGGFILVDSEPEKGATFRIYFPVSGKTEEKIKTPFLNSGNGKGTILIVDDDENIRQMLHDVLTSYGFKVKLAQNGVEALKIYRQEYPDIDLVILDMIMPKMGGQETFIEMKSINKKVRAILSTGYSQEGKAQEILKSGVLGFIQKPFMVKDIIRKVNETLEDPAGN